MSSSPGSSCKTTLFGAVALFVFICTLLLIGVVKHEEQGGEETMRTMKTMTITHSLVGYFEHTEVIATKENLVTRPKLDLNYDMSKRRVPNGPDPIHNRRAGNSKQPPGKA